MPVAEWPLSENLNSLLSRAKCEEMLENQGRNEVVALKLGNPVRLSSSPTGVKLIFIDDDGNPLDEKATQVALFKLNERIFPSKPKKIEIN